MKAALKRATVYFDSQVHRALRLKAAEMDRSVSDLVNDAVKLSLATPDKVLKMALTLKPAEKAELIDKLLSSLDKPDAEIDDLWAKETESRIDAYERGELKQLRRKCPL